MKLTEFSVSNYRSITTAHRIPISSTTVLVGKNNEGKSNLLTALSVAMNILQLYPERKMKMSQPGQETTTIRAKLPDEVYRWERDYPISRQYLSKRPPTTFKLTFSLDIDEIIEFRKEIKSLIDGKIQLEIKIGENKRPDVSIKKRGKGTKALNSKADQITGYISSRISFNHIPAIRTHNHAMRVINNLVSSELAQLEEKEEYKKAIKLIENMQKPILEKLSSKIKEPLSEFLPNVRSVQIQTSGEAHRTRYTSYRARSSLDFEVIVDDGTPTRIEHKGDGVKSLAVLGLLKNRFMGKASSIVAIEEPESHLHPEAIHQLREIIQSLEDENQIVITTHNPLFVNRQSIRSNIIVDAGKAKEAQSIKSIREILGVRVSDNLSSANYVLIVEGKTDKRILEHLLPILSAPIKNALKNNQLIIEPLHGVGNLSHKLSSLENQICAYHVYVDADKPANDAVDKSIKENLLKNKNLTRSTCIGMPESELEDCFNPALYKDTIMINCGVSIDSREFKNSNNKWSERVKRVFDANGKRWTEAAKAELKFHVAEALVSAGEEALIPQKRSSIDALVGSLEMLMSSKKTSS